MEADNAPAIVFDHVSVTCGGLNILDEVCAVVPRGSWTVLIGPNGAGKTTLLLALLGEMPCRGRILVGGGRGLRLGYVPQKLAVDKGMPFTVTEFLSMGVQRRPLWLGVSRAARDQAAALLDMVHAPHLMKRRVGTLSGGEMQRVLLALALQQKPELLILDEPSAGVDLEGGRLFCELLEDLRQSQGFTQIMVSHDLGMAAHHATNVICLKRRVIAQGSPQEVLTVPVLQTLFGMHMGLICSENHVHHAGVQACAAETEETPHA
ncbi:metal ABC transporter ATP-binding protein [uncultured Mailhella sp.]|uniref:metal ABC transporter ATP-binding protein n=1 Tax=uncultured Mailhella sp. TaxID=1981031 RepID=UPI002605A970|nr:metal ABC transporter ATP-binding protein [uncultured Mailhella sp.]